LLWIVFSVVVVREHSKLAASSPAQEAV
jgi:hypothetical protein